MSILFDLPREATPGPQVTNARYERVNSVSDMKNVIGGTHIFRLEPSGTDWWLPNKSYFRTRLKIVVGFNESKYPAFDYKTTTPYVPKGLKQPTNWPLPASNADLVVNETAVALDGPVSVGVFSGATGAKYTTGRPDITTGKVTTTLYQTTTGLRGDSLKVPGYVGVAGITAGTGPTYVSKIGALPSRESSGISTAEGISYIGSFKPFTCLKFLEIADCAVDAFFDQMSLSIGPVRIETVRYPQLINVMKKRAVTSPLITATKADSLGVFSDEQHPHNRSSNRATGKTSVFDILGYDNIQISLTQTWQQEYTVEFDVLYVPPLSIFEQPHAMPPARYEVEFKGVSGQSQVQNNFFHCTLPGGTGRWFMDKTDTSDAPGNLNMQGPATLLDNQHMSARTQPSQHPGASVFVFEPPIAAGAYHNQLSLQNHYLGRRMIEDVWLKTPQDRFDPGCFVSVQLVSMHMEAAMVTGPVQTDSTFTLQFDQLQAQFITLANTNQSQNLIFDVDPFSNYFMFGFRQTTVTNELCLQEGHLVCPANVERDLREYYISFDMKTRPVNFATAIDLFNIRGATNELVRTQINTMTLYTGVPETIRTWLKKGPFYAYDWPRDGTANATRFQLNLQFHDSSSKQQFGTMGPHGMFENETPLVHCNASRPFKIPSKSVENDPDGTWVSASYFPNNSNMYKLTEDAFVLNELVQNNTSSVSVYGNFWKTPTTYYSLYYPCSRSLLLSQSRIDACDRVDPILVPREDYSDPFTGSVLQSELVYTSTMIQQQITQLSQTFGSSLEIDQSYKGTEHSRPQNMALGNSNNSCILFQNIPRKFVVMTASGRVVGVRTIDNRT